MKEWIICISVLIVVSIAIFILSTILYWILSNMFKFHREGLVYFCCFLISLGIIVIIGNIKIS